MAKPKPSTVPGHKITATITACKGKCRWGHEVGDTFPISCYDQNGLCGLLYHQIFPTLTMLQFGGNYPWGKPESFSHECMDQGNAITVELKREK